MRQHYLAYAALKHYIVRSIAEIGYANTLVELERIILELDVAQKQHEICGKKASIV